MTRDGKFSRSTIFSEPGKGPAMFEKEIFDSFKSCHFVSNVCCEN